MKLAIICIALCAVSVLLALWVVCARTNDAAAHRAINALDAELANRLEEIAHLEEQLDKTEQDLTETRRDLAACRLSRQRVNAAGIIHHIDRVAESRW